jgi:hypothetical protein
LALASFTITPSSYCSGGQVAWSIGTSSVNTPFVAAEVVASLPSPRDVGCFRLQRFGLAHADRDRRAGEVDRGAVVVGDRDR